MKRRAATVVASLLAMAACSVLVPSELDSIRCREHGALGPPACPTAHICAKGVCAPCLERETCGDGVDNDCNGRIEDGCAGDAGEDAGVDAAGTHDGNADAAEAEPPSVTLGEPCTSDADCDAAAFCSEPTLLGTQGGPRFCTRGCCSSEQCGAGAAVCFASSGGAALCVPASRVGRPPPGAAIRGSPCLSDAQCRPAWCGESERVCLDVCCRHSDCPGASAPDCTQRSVPGAQYPMFACGRAPGTRAYQDSCYEGAQSCRSGRCTAGTPPFCTTPCCTTSDCGGTLECRYSTTGDSTLRVCALTGAEGNLDIGEVCVQASDCRSAWCLSLANGERMCTDTCCRDADCGDTARFGCRLAAHESNNANWILRCEPR